MQSKLTISNFSVWGWVYAKKSICSNYVALDPRREPWFRYYSLESSYYNVYSNQILTYFCDKTMSFMIVSRFEV